MKELLKRHFGFDEFRPLQEEIIQHVMSKKDTFVLMPTGGGKSLCYQLPALKNEGLTLVISPLIALMKDQVDALRSNGINASFINSSITYEEINIIKEQIKRKAIQLLYIAPERLAVDGFYDFLKSVNVGLIAVDEAHCISEWGHDFRPDYRNLRSLKTIFPNIPIIALTATATPIVQDDIIRQLSLTGGKRFISSFNRENLKLTVLRKRNAFEKVLQALEKHKGESAIIYCFSRKETEKVAADLQAEGYLALPYHAGLDPEVRKNNQELFIKDEVSIMVATIAFGMGIDKPDVRLVVHYTFPKTLEGYYQEIGRAGRDGLPSDCVLLYSLGDKRKHEFFLDEVQDQEEKNKLQKKLDQVIGYCESFICRRKHVLSYFGEEYTKENCGACDTCLQPVDAFDATQISKSIMTCIAQTGNRFGMSHIVKVLKGSRIEKIIQLSHQNLSSYNSLQGVSEEEIKHVIKYLTVKGFIKKEDGMYPTLSVTIKGQAFLKGVEVISLPKLKIDSLDRESNSGSEVLEFEPELFAQLRILRKHIADERNVPPFAIFGDQSLQEMSYYFPSDEENFLKIHGVGVQKLEDLGPQFISLIKTYCRLNNIEPKSILRKTPRTRSQSKSSRSGIGNYMKTKELIEQKKSLAQIATELGFTKETIIKHIERLLEANQKLDLSYMQPDPITMAEISNAFDVCGDSLLKPIYLFLKEKYSYDDIRLVGLLRSCK